MSNLVFVGELKIYNSTKRHRHENWEFVYYIDNVGEVIIDDTTYPFTKGDLYCIPPGVWHYDIFHGETEMAFLSISGFTMLKHQIYYFADPITRDFIQLLQQIQSVQLLKPKNWLGIANTLIIAIEQYLYSWKSSTQVNIYVEYLKHVLVSEISNPFVDVGKLMETVPICPSHFRKLFKAEIGLSPLQYLLELRISNAKQLLSTTSFSVKQIAAMTGFDDSYYFCRIFTKHTGMPPTHWKRKNL